MSVIELFSLLETWVSLATLSAMEIVLGIDNIVFIAIIVSKLPKEVQRKARVIGLSLALLFRVALLFTLSLLAGLTTSFLTILDFGLSGRDVILLAGGLFLLAKATLEIHNKIESSEHETPAINGATFRSAIGQIIIIDLVFSIDSIITAVGLVKHISIMVAAVIISLGVMLIFAEKVSLFIERHPTLKMLALSFLLMIGGLLVAEGMHFHVPKGYIYFAMAFSLFVETLNIRLRSRVISKG